MTHAEKTVSHRKASIEVSKNGPYIVKNMENFIDSQGLPLATQPVMALCRCGDPIINLSVMAHILLLTLKMMRSSLACLTQKEITTLPQSL